MWIKEQMTPKERVLTALQHKETDRVPFSLGLGVNIPARKSLQRHLDLRGMNDVEAYLLNHSDLRWIEPHFVGPKSRTDIDSGGNLVDVWGVKRKFVVYGEGISQGTYEEICHYPLAKLEDISELSSFEWPSIDWWDFSNLKEKLNNLKKDKDYAIVIGNGNIFESSWYMRGFEQMFVDLVIEPEFAWELMSRVTDYFIAYFKKVLEAADGMIDIVFTADDIGQQNGLLLSLDLWEKMIKPHHVRMNKVLHEYGVKILYHTDGAIMEAVPGLIDMGIDILEAIQFDAKGMDPVELKTKYGERLCFHGGVSVQSTLPFGSKEDVREEVIERINVLGKNGGYILAPSHAIQAGTPPENIVEFLKTGKEYYFSH